jgi:hypothetical protein
MEEELSPAALQLIEATLPSDPSHPLIHTQDLLFLTLVWFLMNMVMMAIPISPGVTVLQV